MSRKICVVTGARSDYGLLRWVMEGIREVPEFTLQIVATGMHLSPEFGLTYREIERDGFTIDRRVEMLLSSDTGQGIAKSMGVGLIGFGTVLNELAPDLMLVLGDRFEILAAVAAALVARVPVAHLHGGEITEGSFDDAIRHSITKMSHLHFVAAEAYRRRVIQLGEQPNRVFVVGGLGIDNIKRLELLGRAAVEESLGIQLDARNLLITFHPATLERETSVTAMGELLAALQALSGTQLIFTMPNGDTEGRALAAMVREFVATHPNAHAYDSLGDLRYLSCMKHADGVIGNSSSAIIEAPSLQKGTVNIGDRQKGRLRAASVIDCGADRESIAAAIARLYSPQFQASLGAVSNPYGDGNAAQNIVGILRQYPFDSLLKKAFYDIAY